MYLLDQTKFGTRPHSSSNLYGFKSVLIATAFQGEENMQDIDSYQVIFILIENYYKFNIYFLLCLTN